MQYDTVSTVRVATKYFLNKKIKSLYHYEILFLLTRVSNTSSAQVFVTMET